MSSEANNSHPSPTSEEGSASNGNDDEIVGDSINKKVSHGFNMQIQTQQAQQTPKARKRKRDTKSPNHLSPSMSLSSSSSSSSDEDDETKKEGRPNSPVNSKEEKEAEASPKDNRPNDQTTSCTSESNKIAAKGPQHGHHNHQQQHPAPHQQIQQQPEGWRVKLYRLNADGSWDDCGTGRILCLYKQPPKSHDNSNNSNASSSNATLMGDAWVYQELGEPTLCMHSELNTATGTTMPRILLRTRILLRDAYQRQGDNIITWCEPYLEEGNPAQGVDLALSFQDNAGCLDIWRQITQVQSKAAELFRRNGGGDRNSSTGNAGDGGNSSSGVPNENGSANDSGNANSNSNGNSVADVAHAVAAAHHANLQRQQQQEMWVNVASEAAQHHIEHQNSLMNHDQHFEDSVGGMTSGFHDSNSTTQTSANPQSPQLPNPPSLANLEEIADTIAAVQHIQQRESLAMYISQNDCSYLKSLLSLFPSAESRGDYGSLATLAACVKTILLLNDPSIIELIVADELIFEDVCSTLEYDPDLRDKANHRWFLRERAKFRTVTLMEDEELIAAIHRSFRVNYLRDTLLRPTMDESSLSTLSSLQTFTHADVVKGVTMSPAGTDDKGELLKDSYLAKVIRILGRELRVICEMEWAELETSSSGDEVDALLPEKQLDSAKDPSTIVASGKYPQSQKMSTIWKQHLAPQDGSLTSRRLRRRGALSFLRELFNMVRISLQQSDKDDFFAVLVSMEVDLSYGEGSSTSEEAAPDSSEADEKVTPAENTSNSEGNSIKSQEETKPVNLLSLLGTVLSDPSTDVTEKGSVLEIIAGIAMHDPSLIRRRCLDFYVTWKKDRLYSDRDTEKLSPSRPSPNELKQIIFRCPPNDLLASLLFLLAVETDAGVLLQVSEIMRIILDTDMMGDHVPMGAGFADEAEGIPQGNHSQTHEQHHHPGPLTSSTDQNQFLSMFYDQYVQWLAAPFHYTIFHPARRVPHSLLSGKVQSIRLRTMIERFDKGVGDPLLKLVPLCAIRNSFAVELLSFCVRAHLYRMKCYLLRSRVLGSVLKLLRPPALARNTSGDRCLKLAVLRFLRAILSVNDEFYHRHIIQHDLFAPVFETFRANPVGDNLVSSAIVEMCDFIHSENIKSLIEYIVTKHLTATGSEAPGPSLEDVSSPYVSTLTVLRKAYEKNLREIEKAHAGDSKEESLSEVDNHSRYFHGDSVVRSTRVVMNEKALEDQRKFREVDQEESYFEADDDEGATANSVPPAVDEVAAQEESDMRRTSRMFSLGAAPLLRNAPRLLEGDPADPSDSSMVERDVIHESSEKEVLTET